MINRNPQLNAIALLVYKFGERIPGGGYEVKISAVEMTEMSPHGTFKEVPDPITQMVRWQYFPNHTINTEGRTVPDEPTAITKVEENDRPIRPDETVG